MDADVTMHAWRIDEREYARHESRRGRRHAYERLHPGRTALVVVDMVPFFVAESAYCRGIVPNISRLAGALRAAGGTVAWVFPAPGEYLPLRADFIGEEAATTLRTAGGEGTFTDRLWPEFVPHPDDLIADKTATSAFFPGRSSLPTHRSGSRMTGLMSTSGVR